MRTQSELGKAMDALAKLGNLPPHAEGLLEVEVQELVDGARVLIERLTVFVRELGQTLRQCKSCGGEFRLGANRSRKTRTDRVYCSATCCTRDYRKRKQERTEPL